MELEDTKSLTNCYSRLSSAHPLYPTPTAVELCIPSLSITNGVTVQRTALLCYRSTDIKTRTQTTQSRHFTRRLKTFGMSLWLPVIYQHRTDMDSRFMTELQPYTNPERVTGG